MQGTAGPGRRVSFQFPGKDNKSTEQQTAFIIDTEFEL